MDSTPSGCPGLQPRAAYIPIIFSTGALLTDWTRGIIGKPLRKRERVPRDTPSILCTNTQLLAICRGTTCTQNGFTSRTTHTGFSMVQRQMTHWDHWEWAENELRKHVVQFRSPQGRGTPLYFVLRHSFLQLQSNKSLRRAAKHQEAALQH